MIGEPQNGQASPVPGSSERMIEMDITGITKSYLAGNQKTGKASSKKGWKLSDSLREKITGCGAECLYGE